jgi:hypothetical protein
MTQNDPLERLAETGVLKRESSSREEIAGLVNTAAIRLTDACKQTNAPESRFDLAYNAAHALALAALRLHGYRTDKRYIVFQALPHTLGIGTPTWRLLDRCHRAERNRVRRDLFYRRETSRRSARSRARAAEECSGSCRSQGLPDRGIAFIPTRGSQRLAAECWSAKELETPSPGSRSQLPAHVTSCPAS